MRRFIDKAAPPGAIVAGIEEMVGIARSRRFDRIAAHANGGDRPA